MSLPHPNVRALKSLLHEVTEAAAAPSAAGVAASAEGMRILVASGDIWQLVGWHSPVAVVLAGTVAS